MSRALKLSILFTLLLGVWAGTPTPGRAAARDSLAADSAAAAARVPASTRASWVSDRMPLRVGDIVTVVVDEQTAAREQVSQVATGGHTLKASLNAGIGDSDVRIGPEKSVSSTMQGDSRDVGEAKRQGDLTAVLSVRVTALSPNGVARIEGSKKVMVDGRVQEVSLKGEVRAEDVSASNLVLSSRIADVVIQYKGKKIGPHTGIVGSILSMLWP